MIEQGSPEWLALRCGKVTASRVADIVRKTKSGVSASRARYLGELVSERLTGVPAESFKSADMEWGNATEAQARDSYAFIRNVSITPVPFVDHPTIAMAGASPDHLVEDDGLIEVKCPATHTHISTLLGEEVAPDYVKQMLWQMACTGRKWCDFISFDPRLPAEMQMFVRRFERDDVAIASLEAEVRIFQADIDNTIHSLRKLYAEAA